MRLSARRFFRGLPRYDGVGSTIFALSISADTLRAAQEADALLLDTWADELLPAPTSARPAPRPAAGPGRFR